MVGLAVEDVGRIYPFTEADGLPHAGDALLKALVK
jgi:hypothetical protein